MSLRVLVVGFLRLSVGVRIRHDLKAALRTTASSLSQGQTVKSTCPSKVREDEDGFCKDEGNDDDLPYYCCNVLRSCRADANTLFNYYTKYLEVYVTKCGVTDEHFRLTRDGQRLELVESGENSPACQPVCLVERELKDKAPLLITDQEIVEKCNNAVEENMWKPQLDGAAWPRQKVTELDASWLACGGRFETTTTTTTAFVGTTITTTMSFTAEEPAFEEVDMSFMGSDRVYQGHESSGFWGWSKRKVTSKKEELLRNHVCAKRGDRDMTYYAASLCYWTPDVSTSSRTDGGFGVGLEWSGSAGDGTRFCGNFKETGKCVKCSVCHNNARDEAGALKYESWTDEIALDYTKCKKETVIEAECLHTFTILFKPLIDFVADCKETEAGYQSALTQHEQALAMLASLPRLIEIELPLKISTLEAEYKRLKKEHLLEEIADSDLMRNDLDPSCVAWIEHPLNAGWPIWWKMWEEQKPTKDVLGNMTFSLGDRPSRDHPNYVEQMNFWTAEKSCDDARTRLRQSWEKTNILEQQKDAIKRSLDETKAELVERKKQLLMWQTLEPELKKHKEEKEAEWVPQSATCLEKYSDLKIKKPEEMRRCIPTWYNVSCEKECLEMQKTRGEGCGVMEGGAPSDSRGGLRAVCRPPSASFIKGPTTWDADEETGYKQCARIFLDASQYGRHTQRILAKGMLSKKGSWWSWADRYFILESGDDVRSALMRYWTKDPHSDRLEPERVDKGIIVWDAQSVTKTSANCFKLTHFYRSYEFCTIHGQGGSSADEWYEGLKASLRF